jgi:hypothetical protein
VVVGALLLTVKPPEECVKLLLRLALAVIETPKERKLRGVITASLVVGEWKKGKGASLLGWCVIPDNGEEGETAEAIITHRPVKGDNGGGGAVGIALVKVEGEKYLGPILPFSLPVGVEDEVMAAVGGAVRMEDRHQGKGATFTTSSPNGRGDKGVIVLGSLFMPIEGEEDRCTLIVAHALPPERKKKGSALLGG